MQAVVLVGGEGTRLRPLTLTQPKPALALVDRPFIRYMVDWLGRHGIDEVVMACGFKAESLRAALGDSVPGGPEIRYIQEDEPLGTAGPVRLAADEGLLGDRFMVLNGDVLTDLDLTALQRQHDETGAVITLGLHPVDDPTSYGLVRRADDGIVLGFLEKPDPAEIDTDEVSAGAYVIERQVLDLIPAGRAVSIEREVFPRLVGQGLYGRRLEGYWMDIGTPQRYLQATWDILDGTVRDRARWGRRSLHRRRCRDRGRCDRRPPRGDPLRVQGRRWRRDFRIRAARRLSDRPGRPRQRLDPRRRRSGRRGRDDRRPTA